MSSDWVRVASTDEIDDEDAIRVFVNGHAVAIYYVDDEYYATDDLCTHEHASLADGFLDGTVIECPLHQATFCIKSGKALSPPAEIPVNTYDISVQDGEIYLKYATGS